MANKFISSATLLLIGVLLTSESSAQDIDFDRQTETQVFEQSENLPDQVDVGNLAIDNASSIPEQIRRDWQPKDYLFQFPGLNRVLDPWYRARKRLDEQYGLKPQFSFTNLTQWTNDTTPFATEDNASGYELIVDGTWILRGRGTGTQTMLGFEFLARDKMGTELPPVALFTQTGALYPTTVAFGELDPVVGQLWIQQKFDDRFGFQVGRLFPISAYDFFPLKNFRTDFLDPIHAANIVIPLPERGLGGFVMFRPTPDIYFRFGVHDANADAEAAGFDTFFGDGELFKIAEFGVDPGLMPRQPGAPPSGDVHVTFWHQDEREEAAVDEGWGVVVSASQRIGRFLPFLRYGYSDSRSNGPMFDELAPTALLKQMVNGGLAIDNIFGQSNDRIGIGLTWAEPADRSLRDQKALDVFYRIQTTPEIAITPTLQVVFDPARNPMEDTVTVGGLRTRFTF